MISSSSDSDFQVPVKHYLVSQHTYKKLCSITFSSWPVRLELAIISRAFQFCGYFASGLKEQTALNHELITQSSSPRCCTVPLFAHLKPIRTDYHYRNIPVLTGLQHSIRGRHRLRHKSSLTPAQETTGIPADLAWTNEQQSAHISQRSEHSRPPAPDTI